jgi:hypothetical protein
MPVTGVNGASDGPKAPFGARSMAGRGSPTRRLPGPDAGPPTQPGVRLVEDRPMQVGALVGDRYANSVALASSRPTLDGPSPASAPPTSHVESESVPEPAADRPQRHRRRAERTSQRSCRRWFADDGRLGGC